VKPAILVTRAAVVLPLLWAAACGSVSNEGSGVARVSDLMGWVQRVHVESEVAKQKVQSTHAILSSLVERDFKSEAAVAYREFVRSIEEAEAQANQLRNAVRSMRGSAQVVFDQWSSDLLQIENSQIRVRSEARMDATWRRYQALLAATRHAETGFDSFNKGMRDLALFLGHDLNKGSVTEIGDDARAISDLTEDLDGRFQRTLEAAREYLSASALAFEEQGVLPPSTGPALGEPRGVPSGPGR
jgi:hypothetical protein